MTLIATMMHQGCPIVLADVLLTVEEATDEPFELPTTPDVNETLKKMTDLKVVGLTQKVHILSHDQIVCWAGDFEQGKKLIQKLEFERPKRGTELEGFVNSIPDSDKDCLAFIAVTKHDGVIEIFHRNCRCRKHSYFENVVAAGKGTSALWSILDQFETIRTSGSPNPLEGGIALALKASGYALGEEMRFGGGLRDAWGGGFEIAAFVGGRAQKIENVLYLFWLAQRKSDQEVLLHPNPRLFKVGYWNDLMLMRWCFTNQLGDALKIDREGCHIITRFLQEQEITNANELNIPSFRYDFLFSEVFVAEDDKLIGSYVRTDYFGSGNLPILIEEEKRERYDLYVKSEYLRNLCQGVIGL